MTALNDDTIVRSAIDYIYTEMQIDPEWSIRDGSTFSWWGHQLRQCVWAEDAGTIDGMKVWFLRAETDIAMDVDVSAQSLDRVMLLNTGAVFNALVLDPEERQIKLMTSACLHNDNSEWVSNLFCHAVAMQAAEAEAKIAAGLTRALSGSPAFSEHPISGRRARPDDMLNVLEDIYVPYGKDDPPYGMSDFKEAAEALRKRSVNSTYGADGMAAELPFSHVGLKQKACISDPRPNTTSLLTASNLEKHPGLGSGCLIRLTLPVSRPGARFANELNLAENREFTGFHGLGSWCSGPNGLTHITFLPNIEHRSGLLRAMVLNDAMRASWAATRVSTA